MRRMPAAVRSATLAWVLSAGVQFMPLVSMRKSARETKSWLFDSEIGSVSMLV